jgi:Protein of unknown function (DUF2798)
VTPLDSSSGETMEGKAKFIFPIIMAFFMALMMTAVITWMNLGFPGNYVSQWIKAFLLAWPLASLVAFLAVPLARKIAVTLVSILESKPSAG